MKVRDQTSSLDLFITHYLYNFGNPYSHINLFKFNDNHFPNYMNYICLLDLTYQLYLLYVGHG